MYTPSEIHGLIRDLGVRSMIIRTETKQQLRVTAIPKRNVQAVDTGIDDKAFEVDFSEYEEEEQF